jgi:hypothetical protein
MAVEKNIEEGSSEPSSILERPIDRPRGPEGRAACLSVACPCPLTCGTYDKAETVA